MNKKPVLFKVMSSRILILSVLIFSALFGKAQSVASYTFAASSGTYTPVTAGTAINFTASDGSNPIVDESYFNSVPIGFNFTYVGVAYTHFGVSTNGWMALGSGSTSIASAALSNNLSTAGTRPLLAPLWDDLSLTTNNSDVSYELTGSPGSQVLTVEWNNIKWRYDAAAAGIAFQAKLYEGTNIIEFVYTQLGGGLVSASASIGITGTATGSGNYISLNNSTAAPTASSTTGTTNISSKPANGQVYSFTPPPPCTTPSAQPTALNLVAGTSVINGSFTAAAPVADKYLVVRSTSSSLSASPADGSSYALGASLGGGTVVGNTSAVAFNDGGLSSSTPYYYTVFSFNDLCSGGPLYNIAAPLTGTATTSAAMAYTWNATTGSADALLPASWTPARNAPDPSDTLYFNQGGASTATNLASNTVAKVAVQNNTSIIVNSGASATITIAKELTVDAGSTLELAGSNGLTIAFSSVNSPQTSTIAGTLNLNGTGTSAYNAANSVTTVTSTGVVNVSNTGSMTGALTTLFFDAGANYNHNRNGGTVPTAAYNAGSNVNITGSTSTVASMPAKLGNVFYNCTAQTGAALSWGSGVDTIRGNLTIESTGTGGTQIGAGSATTTVMGTFTQNGGNFRVTASTNSLRLVGPAMLNAGTLNLNASTSSSGTLIVMNDLDQAVSHTMTKTGTGGAIINFSGTASQNITIDGTVSGTLNYVLNNPNGAVLTGILPVNSGASNTLTNGTWSGTGSFAYNATTSTLIYNGAGAQTADVFELPASNGPVSITINKAAGTAVTFPFSRIIPGTLTLTNGDIDLGANNLEIGISAASPGSISGTGGLIRVTTGTLTRWFGTTGLPTSAGTGIGYFPLAAGATGFNRSVSLYFNSATALSTGGTVTLGHSDVSSVTTGLSIADGAYTINNRTDASWTFTTGNGITLGGGNSVGLRATGANLFVTSNVADLRLMQTNAVAGTHVAGTGTTPNFQALRTDLSLADLTASPYHIGASSADMLVIFTAVTTGDWGTPSTWNVNAVPSATDFTLINPGVNVNVGTGTNAAKALTIISGGTLTVNANSLAIDTLIINNGTINLGGGSINLGAAGNNNRTLNNTSGGSLNVSSGNLNIFGNILIANGSNFNQAGGVITVDGNNAGLTTTSVASGTDIFGIGTSSTTFSSGSVSLTGGSIIIVDPHAATTSSNALGVRIGNVASNINAGPGHTIQIGDGVSTDAGGHTDGFAYNSWVSTGNLKAGNLVINAPAGTNRNVTDGYRINVSGNLTIQQGELVSDLDLMIGGDITVNTGATLTKSGLLVLGNVTITSGTGYTVSASTVPQTVGGSGLFRNAATSPTANLAGITVNNSSAGGVTFTNNVSYSGALTFTLGKIFMGNNTMMQIAGATVSGHGPATGWVVGKFQKNATAGAINHTYPVGDASYYTPVVIGGAAGAVLTAGDIIVSTTPGDHPALPYVQLDPLKSVNRYYTVQTANGITFNPGSLTMTLNWDAADVDAGATSASFNAAQNTGGNTWVAASVASPAATSIQVTGLGASLDGDYQVAEALPPISNNTVSAPQLICSGASAAMLTGSTPAGGSGTYTYEWLSSTTSGTSGFAAATGTNTNIDYTPGTLTQTTWYKRVVNTLAATDTSASVEITVTPVIAGNTISGVQTICSGSVPASLTGSTPTGGDATYAYLWESSTTSAAAGFSAAAGTNNGISYAPSALTQTTWYRRTVTSGGCTDVSTAVEVTVEQVIAGNTIGSAQAICTGTIPAQLTGALPSGGSGTYTYLWESSTTSASAGFAAAAGTNNGADYTAPSALTQTTWYRRTVSGGACGSDISTAIQVTVNPVIAGNTIGSPQSICTGATPAQLTGSGPVTGGDGTYAYLWESSTTSAIAGFAAAAGTNNGADYTAPSALTATTWYRRTVTSGGCTDVSSAVQVTVNPVIAGNTVSAGQVICTGTIPATLNGTATVTGGDGSYTYLWESSTVSGATGFSAAAGTNNAAGYTAPAALTQTTWYRRTITSGGCSDISASIEITVEQPIAGNTISGPQTICSGTIPAQLTGSVPSGGSGSYTYLWESSTTSAAAGFAAAAGTNNGADYTAPAALTQTTWYRRTVSGGACGSDISAAVEVTVNTGASITTHPAPTVTICSGNAILLSVVASNATGYQWYKGITPLTNSGNITGANSADLQIINSVTADGGTYSVVVTAAAGCSNVTSNNSTVTVNTMSSTLAANGSGDVYTHTDGIANTYTDASCNPILAIQDASGGNVLGSVTVNVTVAGTVPVSPNGQKYLQRSYEVTPANNGAATVTLYALQSEFTDYNAAPGTYPLMPVTGSNSDPNIPNIRVTKFTGSPFVGGSNATLLTPTSVNWNSTANWWEITVAVPSFSSFYIHTGTLGPLDIELRDISAVNAGDRNRIDWTTVSEANAGKFELERSSDGTNFSYIGGIEARGQSSAYSFWDEHPVSGLNHYRLKMIDRSGNFTYSKTVNALVKTTGAFTVEAYPNPVSDQLTVKVNGKIEAGAHILLADITGKIILRTEVKDVLTKIHMSALAPGVYFIRYIDDNHSKTIKVNKD